MIFKYLLLFLTLTSLYGAQRYTESDSVDLKLEFGMIFLDTSGDIDNTASIKGLENDFKDDYEYRDLRASYFAVDTVFHYNYVPNLRISYFTMNDNKNSDVNATVREVVFEDTVSVSTTLDYSVLSGIIYQDFKIKGDHATFFSKPYYTGDIEFDIGVNLKNLEWRFNIENSTQNAWIQVSKFIFLPYIGFKYYLYDFIAYADVSALAIGDAESSTYNVGVEYQVIEDLYLGIGYQHEFFEVLEKTDTVRFETSGYKVSFKYVF